MAAAKMQAPNWECSAAAAIWVFHATCSWRDAIYVCGLMHHNDLKPFLFCSEQGERGAGEDSEDSRALKELWRVAAPAAEAYSQQYINARFRLAF